MGAWQPGLPEGQQPAQQHTQQQKQLPAPQREVADVAAQAVPSGPGSLGGGDCGGAAGDADSPFAALAHNTPFEPSLRQQGLGMHAQQPPQQPQKGQQRRKRQIRQLLQQQLQQASNPPPSNCSVPPPALAGTCWLGTAGAPSAALPRHVSAPAALQAHEHDGAHACSATGPASPAAAGGSGGGRPWGAGVPAAAPAAATAGSGGSSMIWFGTDLQSTCAVKAVMPAAVTVAPAAAAQAAGQRLLASQVVLPSTPSPYSSQPLGRQQPPPRRSRSSLLQASLEGLAAQVGGWGDQTEGGRAG